MDEQQVALEVRSQLRVRRDVDLELRLGFGGCLILAGLFLTIRGALAALLVGGLSLGLLVLGRVVVGPTAATAAPATAPTTTIATTAVSAPAKPAGAGPTFGRHLIRRHFAQTMVLFGPV